MPDAKAWAILGLLGGLYGILSGIVIFIGGATAANTINMVIMLGYLYPESIALILQIVQLISPTLAAFTFGPIAPMLGLQATSLLSIAGLIVAIHGVLLLIGGALYWRGSKAGAGLMAVIGFIGVLVFNLGGLLGLVAGIAGWYEK